MKSNKSPYYKQKYERIKKRRGKIDMPELLKERQKEKAIKQAKKLLISEGIISESQLVS